MTRSLVPDPRVAPRIDGATRLMGILGEHIEYTLSPVMHNRAAAELGINAAYLPLPLPATQVTKFIDISWGLGAVGFNVTTPHKELIAKHLPSEGRTSVNTVYRGPNGWLATSTDAKGFALGLGRLERELSSFDHLLILGNGGVALALLEFLASEGALGHIKVTVMRRKKVRDRVLRAVGLGDRLAFVDWGLPSLTTHLAGRDPATLLVQATNAPVHGDDLSDLVPALDRFRGVVCDLVYGKPSALYYAAMARDLAAQDGEAMLIEQARLAQGYWWGRSASFETMAAALRGK